jgi:hypothetical protein
LTGGVKVPNVGRARIEIGGYIEAQGRTADEICQLVSYALYRSARQDPFTPRWIVNELWGGDWDTDPGFANAERWAGAKAKGLVQAGVGERWDKKSITAIHQEKSKWSGEKITAIAIELASNPGVDPHDLYAVIAKSASNVSVEKLASMQKKVRALKNPTMKKIEAIVADASPTRVRPGLGEASAFEGTFGSQEARGENTFWVKASACIDAGALLHLDPGARGPILGGGFTAEPVRITAVLDRIVMDALGALDAGDVAARLREANDDDALLSTESWWALDATARIEPPPALDGELHGGLRTIWRSDPPPAGMATVLAAAIETSDIAASVEQTDDGDYIVRFHETDTIALAIAREAAGQAIVYVTLPRICPRERREELVRLAALVNSELPVGCLEVSLELGRARVRTSTDVTGDRLSLAVAENLVGAALHLAGAWFPTVLAVIDGASADDHVPIDQR